MLFYSLVAIGHARGDKTVPVEYGGCDDTMSVQTVRWSQTSIYPAVASSLEICYVLLRAKSRCSDILIAIGDVCN